MPRVFRHRIRVRYGECDPQGIVFNANYLAFFDLTLTEWWREAIGPYNAMVEAGADMVVAETRILFRSPAAFDDELDFELRVIRLGNTAMQCRIEARVGDRLVVEGEIRHVFIDPQSKSKRPMPDEIRAALEPYVAPELAAGGVAEPVKAAAPPAAGVPNAAGAPSQEAAAHPAAGEGAPDAGQPAAAP